MMNEADMIPALEELIIYSKDIQNSPWAKPKPKVVFTFFKGLFKRKVKEEYATVNVHRPQSLHHLLSGSLQKSFPTRRL